MDASDNGIGDVPISVTASGAVPEAAAEDLRGRTAPDGSFFIQGISSGRYEVLATAKGYTTAKSLPFDAHEGRTVYVGVHRLYAAEVPELIILSTQPFVCGECVSDAWISASDLMGWIHPIEPGLPLTPVVVAGDAEGNRPFVRAQPAEFAVLSSPAAPPVSDPLAADRQAWPCALDPKRFNAVLLRLRHTTGYSEVGGFWLGRQNNGGAAFSSDALPRLTTEALPGDGEWHDVTLRLDTASAWPPAGDVVLLLVRLSGAADPDWEEDGESVREAVLDLARVEYAHVP